MKKVICVVEDEKAINDLVNQYLKKEGYEVRSYYTYEEASAHVGDDDVHLWILDIMLDDKSGFDLIEEIRLQGKDITKPFSPKELVLRVNNVMKRVYRNDNNRIMVDGYELDEEQRKVFDGGKEIDLTTKEFDLLMMFIKNKGMAFNREAILTNVWEENYYGSDRVVDDTLRRLRKKLPNLNIHTIYGYGYRLG